VNNGAIGLGDSSSKQRRPRRLVALRDHSAGNLLRYFVLEMLIYSPLVVVYFLVVLRLLGDPLRILFDQNLGLYGFVGLALIVAQGVLLDMVTSFIIRRIGRDRLEK
jgi:hypothetical protein